MQKFFCRFILLMAAVGLLMAFGSCGKKGPPLPPLKKAGDIAAPYDLKVMKFEKDARLTWKHKIDPDKAKTVPEIFDVFMAVKAPDDCEGCPVDFKLAGQVDMPIMEFYVPIKKGYKYYFRVQATDGEKLKSSYSETVQLYDE